jgi:hypothetical protein
VTGRYLLLDVMVVRPVGLHLFELRLLLIGILAIVPQLLHAIKTGISRGNIGLID